MRLIDEYGELIYPNEFMDIAKKGRYYNQVTKIVLDNSFRALAKTNKEISINLSILDIKSKEIQDKIIMFLNESQEHANRVVFEIVESEDIGNFDEAVDFIGRVKQAGVKIAIGYSNFVKLLKYQPDLLKIDGSLIKNIKDCSLSRDIVETIVIFAKKQNIKTVAEFVENEEIFSLVKRMGIDYSQGYAFGKAEKLF